MYNGAGAGTSVSGADGEKENNKTEHSALLSEMFLMCLIRRNGRHFEEEAHQKNVITPFFLKVCNSQLTLIHSLWFIRRSSFYMVHGLACLLASPLLIITPES